MIAPLRERLGLSRRTPGHGLTVDRLEHLGREGILYVGACSCGRWSDRSFFRRLVSEAYVRHVADAVLDPAGKHDAMRAKLRGIRGPLAPSTVGDPDARA